MSDILRLLRGERPAILEEVHATMLEAAAKQAFERAAQLRDGTRISVLALNNAGSALCFADALPFRGRNPETNYDLRFMNYDFQLTSSNQHPTTARQGS